MKIILTLSDDHSICESIKATLPASDVILFESTLEKGMRRLVSAPADLVILDDSPSFGIQALEEINALLPDLPILVLTAKRSDDAIAQYTVAGAKGCIPKPFDCNALNEQVNRCSQSASTTTSTINQVAAADSTSSSIMQHQQALRWMSRNTMYLDSPDRLMQSLLDALIDIIDPARVCILMDQNNTIRITHCHGIPENVAQSLTLTYTQGLMRRLSVQTSLIDIHATEIDADVRKELNLLGGTIAIPLLSKGQTSGAVVLGEKSSGLDYTQSERDLLVTMLRCTSTCLERSTQHTTITAQQQRLNTVLSTITAGVVTVRPDKTISMMNESAERILQLRAPEVLGQPIIKLGSAFADVVLRTMKEGQPRIRQEIRDVSINGQLGLTVTPLGPEGVVAIFSRIPGTNVEDSPEHDISYSPLWEYLATRVAQEIKNPMVPINTYAQLLPSKYDSQEFREEFSTIVQESVSRINQVVESIYEFARHPRLNRHTNDLNESVERILKTCRPAFDKHSIKVERLYMRDGAHVSLDPQMFARALENIVTNSIDAMPDGGTLTIETKQEDGTCSLSVADTGAGVDDKDAQLIFMPFFSTKENGMGLGLTMADRIIKEHNGTIELDTHAEHGGRFILSLPTTSKNQTTN
ncbi:MAG: ATP-binding protein [Candidatus Hydrogenedentota bacterium]